MDHRIPPEDAPLPPEFSEVAEYRRLPDEDNRGITPIPVKADAHSRLKKMLLMPLVATATALTVVFSSFGIDPLGLNLFGGGSSSSSASPTSPTSPGGTASPTAPAGPVETADSSFPVLSNLGRNSYVGDAWAHGVTFNRSPNENYIHVLELDGSGVILMQNNDGAEIVNPGIPGLTYDGDTNTMTLTDYSGPAVQVNHMGNGFTIRLVGDNRLEQLNLWGFYTGGSVTFTGTGSLTVNENQRFAMGIQMDAEWSETCLMVDSGVRLEVYGSPTATFTLGGYSDRECRGAIIISDTTMDQAIYYLDPLTLTGGIRAAGIFGEDAYGNRADQYENGSFHDYSIVDEDGNPSMHVIFE